MEGGGVRARMRACGIQRNRTVGSVNEIKLVLD